LGSLQIIQNPAKCIIVYILSKAKSMCSRAKKYVQSREEVCAVARRSMCSRAKKYVQSREKVCAVARKSMCSRAKCDFDNILTINDLEVIFDTDTY